MGHLLSRIYLATIVLLLLDIGRLLYLLSRSGL